ncbi:6-phospho-beta-glucosidase [Seinonella peptonophila]|uniref:6-phospho-beta-glucosidase n=1 Tax=Seinonella peptonophila TaxID=112248 RepID=A0A1M4VKG6_9BACL|nr:6-phospho-beta-glucosidase [Seinonella peptonophila]SHE69370.1 6-phospho-beta-glucosidase [Seinonella peptonophila]
MSLKVVIIGGGSSYTPEIIEGFINRYQSFPCTEIVLVDIPAGLEKLKIITALAKRMIKRVKLPIQLSMTLDRRSALKGADFVTTQIRVGGLAAREKDERIPLSHGVIGQETNGAGGIFKAFRTIPILLDIAKDMHELCPNAWLINFTNPAGIVTEALIQHSPHKRVIGVCNIPFNMRNSIAEMLGCTAAEIEIEFVGMNHFVFGKRVWQNGIDRTQEVIKRLIQNGDQYSPANIVSIGWEQTFIESLQLIPNPYHQYYFQTDEVLAKSLQAFKENGTRAEIVQKIEAELFQKYQDQELDHKPVELEKRGGAYYSDAACNLMNSIYNDTGDIQTVNIINQGAIPDLPATAVIEANARISRKGPQPLAIGPLPRSIRGMIQQMKAFEELVVEAAISGNYQVAYQAMIMNPLIPSDQKAKTILDEMLEAHRKDLPQFHLHSFKF